MYICIANITLSSSSTSSHLFDIILDYDVLQAWTCPQCPLPLSPNEHERLYDGINEVHIADGINMGTTAALKELETNEIFCEDKIEGPCGPVKGIYARERTFLALKAERLLIRTLVDTSNNKKNLRTFEAYLTKDNHCFDSFEGAKSLTESFPLPVRMIQQIHKEEGCVSQTRGLCLSERENRIN